MPKIGWVIFNEAFPVCMLHSLHAREENSILLTQVSMSMQNNIQTGDFSLNKIQPKFGRFLKFFKFM